MKPMTAATRVALLLVLGCSHKGAGGPARVPVTVARAEQRAVPYEIVATGTAEPRQTVAVQSQVTGVLTHVAFREGDEVTSGQVLFQIDPRPFQAALDQARAMLARDVAQAENATLEATRYAELVKQDYVTKQDYDAKRANAEAVLVSPSKEDTTVSEGVLTFVDNSVDTTTGTVLLKAGFPNRDSALWPGEFLSVRLRLYVEEQAMVVPGQAVMTGQQGTYVFVVNQDGTARSQAVTVERTAGAYAGIGQGGQAGGAGVNHRPVGAGGGAAAGGERGGGAAPAPGGGKMKIPPG